MNPLWLVRMARWARNPPSPGRVKLVLAVVAGCFLLFGYEYFFGWPEALTLEGGGKAHRSLRP
jgi:hypothetical protein